MICGLGLDIEAENLDDVLGLVAGPLSALSTRADPKRPLGLGLRLSARALDTAADSEPRERLRRRLGEARLVPVSANGFAPGPLLRGRVKERIFTPDWREEERLHYTNAFGELIGELAPVGHPISLTTSPGTDRALGQHGEAIADIADGMLRAGAHFAELERRTGRRVTLAIQPVPGGMLETAAEAAAFFERHLFSPLATRRFGSLADLSAAKAAEALPAHLGICLDTAGMAVMEEDPSEALAALRRVGVPVAKLLVGSAVCFDPADPVAVDALAQMELGRHRHPVMGRGADGTVVRYGDLAEALSARPQDLGAGALWRAYRRVPLAPAAWSPVGTLVSTRDVAEAALTLHAKSPIAPEIEIEAAVPPTDPSFVTVMLADIAWVRSRLEG
ncbi:MAG: hypothetical protein AAGC57_00200 [Pseudomonadota bacterium]